MSFKLFILPATVLAILYGFAMTSIVSAETTVTVHNWETECALVDGMVECDITSDPGITHVQVVIESGLGDVTVFEETYDGCPTSVHVSLDPIVLDEDAKLLVGTCQVVEVCEECILCIADQCPTDLPDVGVGRRDPLPLKLQTAPPAMPVLSPSSFAAHK